MNTKIIAGLLVALCFVGVGLMANTLGYYEERRREQEVLDKGRHLVSLISLNSSQLLAGQSREKFQKTLQDHVTSQGLAYCVIQDDAGEPLVVLDPHDIVPYIPHDVYLRSQVTVGLDHQTFQTHGGPDQIYEFARSVFEGGQRSAVIRLGLKFPSVSIFSTSHRNLILPVAFLLFLMVPVAYYGISFAAKPLRRFGRTIEEFCGTPGKGAVDWDGRESVDNLIKGLDTSLSQFKEKYEKLQKTHCRLQTEQGLRTYDKKRFEQILDSLDHGIIITDSQDTISHINEYTLNLLKKMKKEALGKPLLEMFTQDEILLFLTDSRDISKGGRQRVMETTFPDTQPHALFRMTVTSLIDSEGSVTGNVISIYNITDEKSAEKAKHTFIAHAAHELRAPLTIIKSYNEMLMDDDVDDPETKKEFYNTINEETDRLARLIENLLNISKIEMGNMTVEKGLVKTSWLYKDCLAAVSGPAQKKHIDIRKKPPDKWPSLVGDKELLKVALINVLGNAVKYTPENKSIIFLMQEKDGCVVFDVADQGYGVSKEDLPKIFSPFYRAADEKIKEQPGSGLGLAMTADIVRLHNGEINVKSTPGKGTHFRITLPKGNHTLADQ